MSGKEEEDVVTLGEQLKRRREALGISLREISDETRIGVRFLKAIELNQYSVLPGGIFNRSFIRAFARHVSFSEEEALHLYSRQVRPTEFDEELAPAGRSAPRAKTFQLSSTEIVVTVGAIGTVVFGLVVWASFHYISREDAAFARTEVIAPRSVQTHPPSASSRASVVSEAQAATNANPSTLDAMGTPIRVEIKAIQGDCWVSYSIDRQISTHVLLTPGNQKLFEPKDSLTFTLGNAKAVEVAINGQRAVFDGIVVKNIVVNRDTIQKYLSE